MGLAPLACLMLLVSAHCSCPTHRERIAIPQLVVDYALWRGWDHAVIFVPTPAGNLMKGVAAALNLEGVWTGLQPYREPTLPAAFVVPRHRLGVILLPALDSEVEELMDQVSQKFLFNTYLSWLIITDTENITLEDRFRYLNVGLDSDLVVATMAKTVEKCKDIPNTRTNSGRWKQTNFSSNHSSSNTNTWSSRNKPYSRNMRNDYPAISAVSKNRNDYYDKIQKTNSTNMNAENEKNNKHSKGTSISNNTSTANKSKKPVNRSRARKMWARHDLGLRFLLTQVYKLRYTANTSVVTVPLGTWDAINGSAMLTKPVDVEQRDDMQGYPLYIGIKNVSLSSTDVKTGVLSKDTMVSNIDDDIDDDSNLLDVMEFIAKSVNASYELVPFSKLGWKNEEKAWMYLLGAVSEGTVDLGLDNVIITQERSEAMFFSFPIVQSMKNIYFRRPDTGAMRDIFLAPFSPRLLLCVAATGMVLAIAVAVINASTAVKDKVSSSKTSGNTGIGIRWGLGEAAVWSISVLCMQGSPWSPNTAAGSVVLIFSLCFALIIYNAYAAFITSVLSVRVASIKGLDDLLHSDFHFGYTLGGQDEIFLRTVNDTALRGLYFRGLVKNHGVEDASAGLRRVADGGYAFFVSSRLARRGLNTFIAHDKRCGIQELTVEAAKSVIALPMSHVSPYRKLINLSLMRMREAGVLDRMQELMLPSMPRCQAYSTFNSARLSDVYSAFLVLGVGLVIGMGVAVTEALWRRRAAIARILANRCCTKQRQRHSMPPEARQREWKNSSVRRGRRKDWRPRQSIQWHN